MNTKGGPTLQDELQHSNKLVARSEFKEWQRHWEKHRHPVYLLNTLSRSLELNIAPPKWIIELFHKALGQVCESKGKKRLDETLLLTPKNFTKTPKALDRELIAGIIAEAIDSGISVGEAYELTNFEIKNILDLKPYGNDSLKRIFKKYSGTRNGYHQIFMMTFPILMEEELYNNVLLAINDKEWRSKSLKARLQAYKSAEKKNRTREATLKTVTKSTFLALNRSKKS